MKNKLRFNTSGILKHLLNLFQAIRQLHIHCFTNKIYYNKSYSIELTSNETDNFPLVSHHSKTHLTDIGQASPDAPRFHLSKKEHSSNSLEHVASYRRPFAKTFIFIIIVTRVYPCDGCIFHNRVHPPEVRPPIVSSRS